jgi:ADP-heptose:LPS heptosyltransferase
VKRRLVVLRALGLGDLLTAVPALRALARAFPGHRRILAAPSPLADIALATGALDEVVDVRPAPAAPGGGLGPPGPLPFVLAGPDVAVNLHGAGSESRAALHAIRPGRTIAFGDDVPWRDGEHEVLRWCRLLTAHGIPADPGDLDLDPARLPPAPAYARGATLIHPGAASASRRWPAERWAAVARAERDAGCTVLVTGSGEETRLTSEIVLRAGLRRRANEAGRMDVLGLAARVAVAERVVCGDTGVAHLATALRTPSVVLFGPVGPDAWGPPPDRPWHRALWAGGRGDPHGTEPDAALLAIHGEDVGRALADLPGREDVPPRTNRKERYALG